jgi:hypothetical protein
MVGKPFISTISFLGLLAKARNILNKIILPTLQQWKETYGPQGLKFVAIHMPRGEEELDVSRVQAATEEFAIDEPCAIDNEHSVGERFETNGLWLYYLLFDAEGKMKTCAAGNAGLTTIETALKRMIEQEPAVAA